MLSDSQVRFLADILNAVGQVSLASLVMPYFVFGLGIRFVVAGTVATLGSWIMGFYILREIK